MPQSQVWPRRQKASQQQVLTGSALMEGVERTNAVMVCLNQWAGFAPHNSYAMNVNRENKNWHNHREFGHLARNCKNKGTGGRIGKGRRMEYVNRNNGQRRMIEGGNKQNSNLNGDKNLIVLD